MNRYGGATYPCPRCGEPTSGSWSEGGLRWAVCEACMDAERDHDRRRHGSGEEIPDELGDEGVPELARRLWAEREYSRRLRQIVVFQMGALAAASAAIILLLAR